MRAITFRLHNKVEPGHEGRMGWREKPRWRGVLGSAFVCIAAADRIVGWGGSIDFVISRINDPGWIGEVIVFLSQHRDAISTMLLVAGFILIIWNERKRADSRFITGKDLPPPPVHQPDSAISSPSPVQAEPPELRPVLDFVIESQRLILAGRLKATVEDMIAKHDADPSNSVQITGPMRPIRHFSEPLKLLGVSPESLTQQFNQIEAEVKGDVAYYTIKEGEGFASPEAKRQWHITKKKLQWLLSATDRNRNNVDPFNFLSRLFR